MSAHTFTGAFIRIAPALALAVSLCAQEKFDSPDAAATALIQAATTRDNARLQTIFGAQANPLLSSGNPTQDSADLAEFARLAQAKHRLEPSKRDPNRVILAIGDADWPFPVPIVRAADSKWGFDASETKAEMQARRIGANELDVIEICAGYVDAQKKFAETEHNPDHMTEFAARMKSDPGQHNGLYTEGDAQPLIPAGLAAAAREGQQAPRPYHGYYFRILQGQGPSAPGGTHSWMAKGRLIGGFGLVAWPAQYGVTGIHTFIVDQDGIIYEKDIEPSPNAAFPGVTRYDPDKSWRPVE
jgi:hypothetical protein